MLHFTHLPPQRVADVFNVYKQNLVSVLSHTKLFGYCYIIYFIVHAFFFSNIPINSVLVVNWLVIFLIYLIARIFKPEIIYKGLIFIGIAQSIVVILQFFDIINSRSKLFDITGFFTNPGHLGCFQTIPLIIAIYYLIEYRGKKFYFIHILNILFIALSILISDSRASWFAIFCGLFTYFFSDLKCCIKRNRIYLIVIIAIIFILYTYRVDSVNARILGWRVSLDMIINKPILGNGIFSFDRQYMLYQSNYLSNNKAFIFADVANNISYPYNELLHIVVEQGLVGGTLFILFCTSVCYTVDRLKKTLMITLLSFSLFTYPTGVFGLLLLYPVIIAQCIPKEQNPVRWPLNITVVMMIIIVSYKEYNFYKRTKEIAYKVNTQYDMVATYFIENFEELKYYREFNLMTSEIITYNRKQVKLDIIEQLLPTCESYCNISKYYYNIGDYKKAEQYLIIASNMIPSRVTPKYLLWRIYIETNNHLKAQYYAKLILNQDVKFENTETLRMKNEIQNYLNTI